MTCSSIHRRVALAAALLCIAAAPALAKVRVVCTTPTYADIVRQIGGRHVRVLSIMRGPENMHNIQPKPSYMLKVKHADLFVHTGLDAELWAPLLIRGSRNPKIAPGKPGNVDLSRGIELLEVPAPGTLSRAQGDIHIFGNPHYWLDPLNGIKIARTISDALKRADPKHAGEYEANYRKFADRIRRKTAEWLKLMAPYRGTKVVVYHRGWPYFRRRFGLVKIAEVEPKPGISPGPQHLAAAIEKMKQENCRIVIVETYNNRKNADFVAQRAGGKAVLLATHVNGIKGVDSYEKLFDYNIHALLKAFHEVGIEPQAPQPSAGAAGAAQPAGKP